MNTNIDTMDKCYKTLEKLLEQRDKIEKVDNNLNNIQQHLSYSEYLVKKMSSFMYNIGTKFRVLKSESLAQAVSNDVSVVNEMEDKAIRSCDLSPQTSSVDKCCACAALPPLPHHSILFPLFSAEIIISEAFFMSAEQDSAIAAKTSELFIISGNYSNRVSHCKIM